MCDCESVAVGPKNFGGGSAKGGGHDVAAAESKGHMCLEVPTIGLGLSSDITQEDRDPLAILEGTREELAMCEEEAVLIWRQIFLFLVLGRRHVSKAQRLHKDGG